MSALFLLSLSARHFPSSLYKLDHKVTAKTVDILFQVTNVTRGVVFMKLCLMQSEIIV